MSELEKKKAKARSRVHTQVSRGKMKKSPCEFIMFDGKRCNLETVESHHADYDKPLEVKWLCKTHHKIADLENLK